MKRDDDKGRDWRGMGRGGRAMAVTVFLLLLPALVAAQAPRPPEMIKIAFSFPSILTFPIVAANDRGFYRQELLNAKFVAMGEVLSMKALVGGDIEYSIFIGGAIRSAVTGLPVKMVANISDKPPFYIVSKPEVRSIGELKGKTFGGFSLGSSSDYLTRLIFRKGGIDPDREITTIDLGSTPNRFAALKAGSVDATILIIPFNFRAEQQGFKRLAYAGDYVEFAIAGLATSDRLIDKRPEQIKATIKAILRAVAFAKTNREETLQDLIKILKADRREAELLYEVGIAMWRPDGLTSDESLRINIDFVKERLKLKEEIPFSKVADFSFAKKALEELKRPR